MSLHIGMDKHGVRWKDRGNCWLFGQTKFQSIAGEKGRMLSGRIWIQIFDGDDAKELLFAVYIA